MSVNINVVTQYSNKSVTVTDMSGVDIITSSSNEIINIPYNQSYVLYIEKMYTPIEYPQFLDLTGGILSGFYGYIWIILIMFIFYFLIKGVKNYVK